MKIDPQSTQTDPVTGDTVHFMPDSTLCEVIGVLSDVKPLAIFMLRHPRLGDLPVHRKVFCFPVGAPPSAPTPKVYCAQCRWRQFLPTPEALSAEWGHETPRDGMTEPIPICREPGRVSRSTMDYVLDQRIPISCYSINATGDCSTFERVPNSKPPEAKE